MARVEQWVDQLNARMPPHVASQLRYETEVYRNAVTLVECRSLDPREPQGEWYRLPFARLRFTRSRDGSCTGPTRTRSSTSMTSFPSAPKVDRLLREISDDPSCIFFG
jgi:hypothetical protein